MILPKPLFSRLFANDFVKIFCAKKVSEKIYGKILNEKIKITIFLNPEL